MQYLYDIICGGIHKSTLSPLYMNPTVLCNSSKLKQAVYYQTRYTL